MPHTLVVDHIQKDLSETLLELQQQAFMANPMPSLEQRQNWLTLLQQQLINYKEQLAQAISADFGHRSQDETLLAEILPSLQCIKYAHKSLKSWLKPRYEPVSMAYQPATAQVYYQPLGVVGVVVPWNYPLYLTIGPLVGALAAGNRVMIKLSEYTPNTSALVKQMLAEIYTEDLVAVVEGGQEVSQKFCQLPFNHLLFTGSSKTAVSVMQAAAANLTPVTLELGGKSPVIIADDIPMQLAAERIAFGKAINAGQTCVAPDYILISPHRVDEFVTTYQQVIKRFYPSLINNPDATTIINHKQYNRLQEMLTDAEIKGAQLIKLLPEKDQDEKLSDRLLPHYLLLNVNSSMQVMQQEIFGPLLPIMTYNDIADAVQYINHQPKPLALYYFGFNKEQQQYVLQHTQSGGVAINDTLLQVAQSNLPFGGVGQSGMGQYHGYEGFLTFSKAKSVFTKGKLNTAKLIYPPYRFKKPNKWLQLVYKLFIR
ncbi:coniferyl aldehyde dehydrogenase [Entomomonas asaccharolytica]|uniref:Aldehyde dehydrogenase n=1 Tax=Entomomonas asaccharolytica TaxID=2785331 RepID=A0A974NDV7_9GAMM|nr:coniferyl aldehyde dehydrogenase [Entomomonas asaccharolytica]QQP84684.1 coniferyl aldehyde dehydrogenase [Entomomonas asaccharolytica]